MANKARYYGIATKEEKQDVDRKDRASRIYPSEFGYSAILAAILNYKDKHPSFDELPSALAADRIAGELNRTGLYETIETKGSRIIGDNYSIALTKGRNTGGQIILSKATEQKEDEKRKKKK